MNDSTEESTNQPSQEELREQIEEQLRRIRVQDVLLESVAGLLNLAARRITKEDERDLEQARIGIEAARAVVGLLDEGPAGGVRDAIAELQVLYAKEAQGGPSVETEEGESPEQPRRGSGASGLWTPPGSG